MDRARHLRGSHGEGRSEPFQRKELQGVESLSPTLTMGSYSGSLEPGPSRARYFPRDMLLLTTTARERAWRLLKISSSLIG